MQRMIRFAISILVFLVLMTAWEIAVRLMQVPSYIVPGPLAVAQSLYKGLSSGLYLRHMMVTLAEILSGYGIGFVLALGIGTAIALSRTVEYYVYPYIVALQSMPKVALAPVIMIWFGLGMTSKIVLVSVVCFFPILVNTVVGLKSADADRINLMRSLDADEWQIFRMLRMPSALPFIMAGMEVAVVLALISAIVAEFVGAENGLGMLIQTMTQSLDVASQFSILIVLSAIGLTLTRIVKFVGNKLLFWDASRRVNRLNADVGS
jgi:NitT/TauT family transport system permease protein